MSESSITVMDMSSGEEVRTITRGSSPTYHQQVVTPFCGQIGSWLTLFAQRYSGHSPTDSTIYGETFTLPGSLSAKWHGGAASATTQQVCVLRRRPLPSGLYAPGSGSPSVFEATTTSTSATTIIDAYRFFLVEPFLDAVPLSKQVQFKTLVGIKTANTAATAYLTEVSFKLRKLTGADTYTDIVSKAVPVNLSNATKTYVDYAIVADAWIPALVSVSPGEVLVLEISTKGYTSSTSYAASHRLCHSIGSSDTFIEIMVEDI